jgi:hypothetical protein
LSLTGYGTYELIGRLRGNKRRGDEVTVKLGVIPTGYTSGPPTVLFDGETTASARTYPVADHVTTLAAGKAVIVQFVNGSGVIVAAWTR